MSGERDDGWQTRRQWLTFVIGTGSVAPGLLGLAPSQGVADQPNASTTQTIGTPPGDKADAPAIATVRELRTGKVVSLAAALKRRGVAVYADETKGQFVLEADDGALWNIVPDWRGRAFYQDTRLRDRAVELVVRRQTGSPFLQVLAIYTFDAKGTRQLTDYWCDICSIPMFEIKPCECCQEPIRLRFQPQDLPADLRPAPK